VEGDDELRRANDGHEAEPAGEDPALLTYEAMAPVYDEFNAQNRYDLWFDALIPKLEALGLRTGKLLDVACGTGRAFPPMLERGWEITACDLSPSMVELAVRKHQGDPIIFDVCDMRRLPVYREDGFNLVWALNDPVNYLLGDSDLQLAVEAMGQNLAEDGLLVFDTNTLGLFKAMFEEDGMDRGDPFRWEGRGQVGVGIWEAEMSGEGVDRHVHRYRHWSVPEVREAIRNAGYEPVAAMGQRESPSGLMIADDWDEDRDVKILHVARRG
jgi:SAM-dependent methyltransferase